MVLRNIILPISPQPVVCVFVYICICKLLVDLYVFPSHVYILLINEGMNGRVKLTMPINYIHLNIYIKSNILIGREKMRKEEEV